MRKAKKRKRSLRERNKLVEQWSGLTVAMVKKIWHKKVIRKLGFKDAVQVGMFGLISSASNWDKKKGILFSTYAAKGIIRSIFRVAYIQQSLVMLPHTRPTPENLVPYVEQAKRCYLCSVLPELEDERASLCPLQQADIDVERAKLREAISLLDERNGEVFSDWLDGKKTVHIALEYGISKQRVHQLLHNAIRDVYSLLKNRDSDESLLPTSLLQMRNYER